MQAIFKNLKGDKLIWAIAALLAVFSLLPVYSAASNLVSGVGSGTLAFMLKHLMHLVLGFLIMYGMHKIPYRYFKGLSLIMMPVVLVLLLITLMQGNVVEGTNANRWIQIPIVNMSFQSSTFASVVLMIYIARYLSKIKDKQVTFKETILPLWAPVFFVLALILPANFSTTAIIFSMVIILAFIGGYPLKYLAIIIGSGILVLALFVLTAKAFPGLIPNRVDTWISRIEDFSGSEDKKDAYQIEKAKIAIASGGVYGRGFGKSIQKNFLPQSSSDFIFAIIIEEIGLLGGLFVIVLYLWLLVRIVIVVQKSPTVFGKLVVLGVGIPIVFQAFINMAVAVELFPVTGQTLPLISRGGTSIWMICMALGVILSVSAQREEVNEELGELDEENPLEILSETI